MALYRKYRPASFAEVVGQEHVTEPLCNALEAGRINHAYLFSGPRGCGKTSSARILARSLNCEKGPTANPCGECHSCVALAPNGPGNIDVVELDAASHGGVDDTRELRDRAFYAPAQSRYRIFIIDEAHMVTNAGFNALLKIVEEPPEHLIFVFATTEPEKVLPTIRSRTHHYPFRLLPPKTMRGLLEKICAQEDVAVDDAVYPLVIRAGGGSPRDTLSVLDQLLAGAEQNRVVYQRALSLLGATDMALIDRAVDALAAGDGAALFGAVEAVIDAGHDPRRFGTDLLERFRDLIVLQIVPDAATRGVVDAPDDVMERMRDQAAQIGTATLTRYAEVMHAGLGEMRGATAPRLLLEVVCARLLLPSASDTEAALLQRIERIETRMNVSIPSSEAPAVAPAPRPAPIAQAAPAPAESFTEAASSASAANRQFMRRSQAPQSVSSQESEPVAAPPAPRPAPEPAPVQRETSPEPVREPVAEPVAPPPAPAPEPVPAQPAAPAAAPVAAMPGEPDAAAVRAMWPTVREKVRARSRSLEAMLMEATVRGIEGDTLVLAHPAPPLAKRLSEQHNTEVLREALKDALGVNWRVRCDAGAAPAGAANAAPASAPRTPAPTPEQQAAVERAEEEDMLAEAANDRGTDVPRRDPEEVALELLKTELGAKPLSE
ncbi:DNA polymerase III subunits gamma/tau [Mycobacterium sp. CBMA293]|uniref:DNA polymerase III subunits gamma/tau n=1 Tax=unclassified Mycolicibacterium TaxID=2636767 RepID=UPI0013266B43|nr:MULTISPECIES: DNA polymerase III subunits gamma/tau [unclassified Mycolicibacterium]MUL46707.1 DNA polymerase III subunits gamma/tau [Mycolicibacterium sp. CBMA 360]MUL94350.1 DNA polymerase III subunits gamma/tau [Mycolicibacterium sp. CBMA 230]MUM31378.1 DNA polymerase III subunits gamma/tau [Mycolicibacterium sp. CBMA 361]MUL58992.1 DNA polymerase III subunits gamma/tau [Mycolicibacterium sp. CBMA 335]MUL69386.1 DNA polymerase III subunits gamma/tau [Mycolicibacterium sp. CBMA 311]